MSFEVILWENVHGLSKFPERPLYMYTAPLWSSSNGAPTAISKEKQRKISILDLVIKKAHEIP